MYLLDTNHCSRLIQGHPALIQKLSELGDVLLTTCVIVRGELMFMAYRSNQRAENLRNIREFLSAIHIYAIDNDVANIYGEIKAAILDRFGPREKKQRRKIKIEDLGFTDNDLWIASVAKYHGLIVVSADSDFQRIKEVSDLRVEEWWNPDHDHLRR